MLRGENYSLDVDPAKYYGRKIVAVQTSRENGEDSLFLKFDDGACIRLYDAASYCCEHRYMTCDDDVQSLIGGTLTEINVKAGPAKWDESNYSQDDIEFLEVRTDKGFITIANHNDHNGYYGGFELALVEREFPDV